MADTFNHFHYLDQRLLAEEASEASYFNWEEHYLKRKQQFPQFKFIVLNDQSILHNDLADNLKINEYGLNFINDEMAHHIYFLRIHNSDLEMKDMIYLSPNSKFIQENIPLKKTNYKINLLSSNNVEYYHLINSQTNQLFLNNICFESSRNIKTYFLTTRQKAKVKNSIIYYLEKNSNLEHSSFSDIQNGQLEDDSIEVFHSSETTSKILYQSLNRGKISSQVNSVINERSEKCSTIQNIKHIVLDKNAITNSKPNLIIKNPNVEASHGNSVCNFNVNDLFYLAQRGLNEEQSYNTLSKSMLLNFIDKTSLNNDLLNYLEDYNE